MEEQQENDLPAFDLHKTCEDLRRRVSQLERQMEEYKAGVARAAEEGLADDH